MKTNTTTPTPTNQVYTTTDYFLFKYIKGNRKINHLHIKRLKKSMAINYLYTVIVVNEKYEIIDGQHRFEVIKELNLPLNYVICVGYGLEEVHILNQNSETWKADHYLDGYCDLGYQDYISFRKFRKKYNLGHSEALYLLAGSTSNTKEIFNMGKLKIKDLKVAEMMIEKILSIEPYYSGVKRRSFIHAMVSLMKNPTFDVNRFLHKLSLQPKSLVDCTTSENYKAIIETIYNYRVRSDEKVNLRIS